MRAMVKRRVRARVNKFRSIIELDQDSYKKYFVAVTVGRLSYPGTFITDAVNGNKVGQFRYSIPSPVG